MDLSNLIAGVKPEESNVASALPNGSYNVIVEKIEPKTTKAGGKALNIMLRVFGDKFNNAVIFDFINVQNSNPEAENIGKARLARIASLLNTSDTDKMLGKKLTVNVVKESNDTYGDKNRVKSYDTYVQDSSNASATTPVITTDDIPW